MKIQLVFLLWLVFTCIMAQEIVVNPTFWDFGTIKDDKIYRCSFSIINKTERPVSLTSLPASCGCSMTVPEPNIIPSCGEAKVYVAFQPKGQRGLIRWDAALATDLQSYPKIVIPLTAYVLRDAVLSDGVVNFRVFKRGEEKSIVLWCAYSQNPNFRLYSAVTSVAGFATKFEETTVSGFYPGDQRGYRIEIIARKDIGYGRNSGILLLTTDIPDHEKMEIRLFAYVIGDITAAPEYMSFGVLKPGMSYKRQIIVSHNEHKKFNIRQVVSSLPFVSTELQTVIPEKYYYIWVTLKCPIDIIPGEFRGTLQIHTDCPTHNVVDITVQGFVPPG